MKKLVTWNKIKNFYHNFIVEFWIINSFALLLLIPLFWLKSIGFDLVRFTEEYYKTVIVCMGISFLVIFYTDKNKERTKKRIIKNRKSIAEDIKNKNYQNYDEFISDINSFLKKTIDLEITYNNSYLDNKEEQAKQEMEYIIKNNNSNSSFNELSDTITNIKRHL